MYTMTVRKMDDDAAKKLKELARAKGLSLEQLSRQILTDYARAPELRAAEERFASLSREMIKLYQAQTAELADRLAANTHAIERIIEIMEGGKHEH